MAKIIGDNQILTTISEEPFWKLLKAESASSGEQVWFKILSAKYAADRKNVLFFQESAAYSQRLRHPNILPVLDYGSEKKLQFIVMEPFDGTSLARMLKKGVLIDEERAVRIFLQICSALQFAHINGVPHGILTPESIFVNQDDAVAIVHFGSEALVNYLLLEKRDPNLLKYARYFPPERLTGEILHDSRSELYSVGVIFYQMLTGKVPFAGKNYQELLASKQSLPSSPKAINGEVSAKSDQIVKRLLNKNIENRYPNFNTLIRDLSPQEDLESELEYIEEDFEDERTLQRLLSVLTQPMRLFSPHLVGSKRRIAYTVLTFLAIIVIGVVVAIFSEYDSSSLYQQRIYPDITTSTDSVTAQNESVPIDSEATTVFGSSGQSEPIADTSRSLPMADTIKTVQVVTPPVQQEQTAGTEPDKVVQPEVAAGTAAVDSSEAAPPAQTSSPAPAAEEEKIGFSSLVVYSLVDSSMTPTEVFLNDEMVGQTSAQEPLYIHGLVVGRNYKIRILKDGFEQWQKEITLAPGDSTIIRATLQPLADALRRITFAKVDFADRIIVDNRLPSHSLPFAVDLALGKHHLRYIDSQNVFFWETEIVLDMNSPSIVYFDADQIGYGQISVILKNPAQYGYAFVVIDGNESSRMTTPARLKLPVGRHQIKVFRQGFVGIPEDTTIFVRQNEDKIIRFLLKPISESE